MPFDPEFDSIYDRVIKSGLELAGLSVKCADDIQNQRNILRDVFDGIVNSDLIVADLTNLNPNVFYELAVAHAFRKPVILITQNMDEVPFDLKPYRLIEYDVHFAKIEAAKEKLTNDGKAFLAGELQFGNPFADFSSEYSVHSRPKVPARETNSQTLSGYASTAELLGKGGEKRTTRRSQPLDCLITLPGRHQRRPHALMNPGQRFADEDTSRPKCKMCRAKSDRRRLNEFESQCQLAVAHAFRKPVILISDVHFS